ncbi:MAG: biopolymer transporter ExbD [Prevotellaceae bacterium]|jgi:biopolymer transport protein ExbD|nr:biopolymer transporter ExbD [Prevotellaceae bacterium]
MGKVKAKKQNTFIDMTAMSDVTVLLLTFFMLTATFLPKEPVQVLTPASVSEVKVPEYNTMTILITPKGQVFLNLDRPDIKVAVLDSMGRDYGMTFTDRQKRAFIEDSHIGVPMGQMSVYLNKHQMSRNDDIRQMGIPTDSINNQLARWVTYARRASGKEMRIAIKSDQITPYPLVSGVIKTLVELKENRYSLITTLRAMPSGL